MINKPLWLNGWNFMRLFRLGLGILFAIQAYFYKDKLTVFFSAIFLFQAFTNTGCCGSAGCSISNQKDDAPSIEEATFEEIKIKK